MSAYRQIVSIRSLFAVLIALAMLVAPTLAEAGAAADTQGHQMLMMDHSSHCQAPISGSADHHKSDGKSCCVSTCVALAVAPAAPVESVAAPGQLAHFAPPKTYRGLLTEIATPPPR